MESLIWNYRDYKELRTTARASPDLCCCLSCLAGSGQKCGSREGCSDLSCGCTTDFFFSSNTKHWQCHSYFLHTFSFSPLLSSCYLLTGFCTDVPQREWKWNWWEDWMRERDGVRTCGKIAQTSRMLKRDLWCEGSSLIPHPVSRVWE